MELDKMAKRKRKQRLTPRLFEFEISEAIQRFQHDLEREAPDPPHPLPSVREFVTLYNTTLAVAKKVFERLSTYGVIEKKNRQGAFLLQKPSEWSIFDEKSLKNAPQIRNSDLNGKMIGLLSNLQRQHPEAPYNRAFAMFNTMDTFCHRHGAISFLFNTYPKHRIDQRMLNEIKMRSPDALIFLPTMPEMLEKDLDVVRNLNIPLVVSFLETFYTDNIIINEESMAYNATRHLLELGHKKLIYLRFKTQHEWDLKRQQGFQRALNENNDPQVKIDTLLLPYDTVGPQPNATYYIEKMEEELPAILSAGTTALISPAPTVGNAILKYADKNKIRIPEELAFVNIGNDFRLEHLNMTTVRYPTEQICQLSLDTLVKRMRNPSSLTQQLRVPGELIRRGTT